MMHFGYIKLGIIPLHYIYINISSNYHHYYYVNSDRYEKNGQFFYFLKRKKNS